MSFDDLDWNYCLSNAAFFGNSKPGEVVENRDVFITCCGVPNVTFNTAFVKFPVRDLDACLRRARQYFGARELPFRITLRSDRVAEFESRLGADGFREAERFPGMQLLPIRDASKPHSDLRVRVVETPEDLAAFQNTAFAGFGLPAKAGALYLTEAVRVLPNVRFYLGSVDGRPVCTSALVSTGTVAGVYWVATLKEFRGRGLGEAISWEAVKGGLAAGCEVASLQASKMGRPVYERMGFETVFDYVHFEN